MRFTKLGKDAGCSTKIKKQAGAELCQAQAQLGSVSIAVLLHPLNFKKINLSSTKVDLQMLESKYQT